MREARVPDEKPVQCNHAEPYEGYAEKHKRRRYIKGKHYVWCKCAGCNVIFLGVFWQKAEEAEPTA